VKAVTSGEYLVSNVGITGEGRPIAQVSAEQQMTFTRWKD